MKKVIVVGMGVSADDLSAAHLKMIRSAGILMGGRRHLAPFADLNMEKKVITGRMEETIDFIRDHMADARIVVLASGDPLFFGIGTRICGALGRDQVVVLPNITSAAAAFARINEPWADAKIISLHGRDNEYHLLSAVKTGQAIAVLTDGKHTPAWLAGWLVARGADHLEMAVFEKMGMPEEKFGWYSLAQAAAQNFAQPNVVILKTADPSSGNNSLTLGMADEAYLHEGGLITKPEVRAVVLSKLQLKPGQTLWDLGAGSGSVGIEASVLLGPGRIVAVETHATRVAHIRENANRYNVHNLECVQAALPDGMADLPPPDRIFIGGGGRDLSGIVRSAVDGLGPGGRLVVNTVLLESLTRTLDVLEEEGMTPDVVQMQVSRGKEMPWSRRFEAANPVWIITSEKR